MFCFAFLLVLFTGSHCIHNGFENMDLIRHHPSKVISLLIGTCRENEQTCPMSIESTAHFLSNINELILNFDEQYDHNLITMIERLSLQLMQCKDVQCVMKFEKHNRIGFDTAISKAADILSKVPQIERQAWERTILQPPPYF